MTDRLDTVADSWRVVVFTTSGEGGAYSFLEDFLESLGHRIVGVVTTPGPSSRRTLDYRSVVAAAAPDVDVIVSTHRSRWAAMLAPLRPDLIISAAFPLRIPDDVIALPRLGAINGHDALLPRYRGPNPQGWVFRNGDTMTGYTIHRLIHDFDAGPILSQVQVPVTDDDDFDTLFAKLMPCVHDVFAKAFVRVARGDLGDPQNDSLACPAPFFEESWAMIDWSRPARTIHNQVRSLIELPGQPAGAIATVDGTTLRVVKTRLVPLPCGERSAATPGALLACDDDGLLVQCGDGPLRLIRWRDEET